ncbi:Fungalysin metallopeptidase-domain-containing protein [Entophlyctis helioformis]|nr:Fungalysin metallopeptidase-domain-containing protein [Entophlyctis helioformis]
METVPDDHAEGRVNFLIKNVPRTIKDVPAKLKYVQTDNGKDLVLVWDLVMDLDTNWFHMQVDAATGELRGLLDWVNGATYTVYPLGINDPLSGDRVKLVNPEHPVASPKGWHTYGNKADSSLKEFNTTKGNNVFAQENLDGGFDWKNNYRPSGGKDLIFDFKANFSQQPSTYLDATITNLFYYNNIIHDLFHVYGFNEVAGNFQMDNFNRGGKGNDAVIANAQDGSGTNNANFATPPDGEQPRMRMYVWTQSKPYRDGDMEGGIIIHEYAHGISIRLTGGPANVGCLGWGESGGMGEGWGDFFATILRTTATSTREDVYAMGEYSNGGNGIRNYKYSTSLKENPSTYKYVKKPGYWGVHAKGEVWAVILYEVYWNLVDKHGFEGDWFNVDTSDGLDKLPGNKLALQLVVDALKLQPCYPTFVDARDAILLADQIGTYGANQCEIWKAFAKRGLGVNAVSGGGEDFDLPTECQDPKEPDVPEPTPDPPTEPPKDPKDPEDPKKPGDGKKKKKKPKKPVQSSARENNGLGTPDDWWMWWA